MYFNLINHCMGNEIIPWHVWLYRCTGVSKTNGFLLIVSRLKKLVSTLDGTSNFVPYSKSAWSKPETRKLNEKRHGILQRFGCIFGDCTNGPWIRWQMAKRSESFWEHSCETRLGSLHPTLIISLNGLATFYSVKLKMLLFPSNDHSLF